MNYDKFQIYFNELKNGGGGDHSRVASKITAEYNASLFFHEFDCNLVCCGVSRASYPPPILQGFPYLHGEKIS